MCVCDYTQKRTQNVLKSGSRNNTERYRSTLILFHASRNVLVTQRQTFARFILDFTIENRLSLTWCLDEGESGFGFINWQKKSVMEARERIGTTIGMNNETWYFEWIKNFRSLLSLMFITPRESYCVLAT